MTAPGSPPSKVTAPAELEQSSVRRGLLRRWHHRVRSNPVSHRILRVVVAMVGFVVVVIGLILVPFPGPGWAIVFLGIAIWATEFAWAHHLLRWGKGLLRRWTNWLSAQAWPVRVLVGLGLTLLIVLVFWGLLAAWTVPGWLPDPIEQRLDDLPGV